MVNTEVICLEGMLHSAPTHWKLIKYLYGDNLIMHMKFTFIIVCGNPNQFYYFFIYNTEHHFHSFNQSATKFNHLVRTLYFIPELHTHTKM